MGCTQSNYVEQIKFKKLISKLSKETKEYQVYYEQIPIYQIIYRHNWNSNKDIILYNSEEFVNSMKIKDLLTPRYSSYKYCDKLVIVFTKNYYKKLFYMLI